MRRDIDKRANQVNEGGDKYYDDLLTKESAQKWGYLGKILKISNKFKNYFRNDGIVYARERTKKERT